MKEFSLSLELIQQLQPETVFIFPTETIYGIGCSALCEPAVARLFEIKRRPPLQPPPLLVADDEQLERIAADVPFVARSLMNAYWPGSLTLILPARDNLPPLVCGYASERSTRTVGVRWTAHPIAAALCIQIGTPLIATSANIAGATGRAAQPQSLEDIAQELKTAVDVVLDGGPVQGVPSTVVDCTSQPPRLLRAGAVAIEPKYFE